LLPPSLLLPSFLPSFFFFFWFWGLNSGLHTLGQLLYCLSHTSNPLAVYFEPVSCLTGGHGGGVAGGRKRH
jgi:hypothetical protein